MARGVLPVTKDDTGAIFLDRDAKHFQLVLNYLRDGWCSLPKPHDERRELLQEIRYYQASQRLLVTASPSLVYLAVISRFCVYSLPETGYTAR